MSHLLRHGAVEELLPPRAADSRHTLRALVPLAHLLGYASSVRSLTHGEASLSMEFSHYAPLDAHTEQQRLLELRGAVRLGEDLLLEGPLVRRGDHRAAARRLHPLGLPP